MELPAAPAARGNADRDARRGRGEGYIYLREEYAHSRERLERAIAELRSAGLLNGRPLELVVGAGAYIAGEETAMLESMEGRRAMPRLRPPFPSQSGYLGRPTLIDNVETLAHVAGDPAYRRRVLDAELGSGRCPARSRGPAATRRRSTSRARQLIDEYAGGATAEIGAIVPGGAASGILPPAALDVPLTREALARVGLRARAPRASRSFPPRTRVLRLLAETMRFFAEESCQKCTPCRIGNRALHHSSRSSSKARS